MSLDINALKEAAKLVIRTAILAGLTALIGWLTTYVSSFDPTTLQFVIGTAVLAALDKYIHEAQNIKANGIVRF